MCLTVSHDVHPAFDANGEATCFKVVGRDDTSPFYPVAYRPGQEVRSDRSGACDGSNHVYHPHDRVFYGIHVLLKRKDAECLAEELSNPEEIYGGMHRFKPRAPFRVIEVVGRVADFVAAGYWNGMEAAVFNVVRVPPAAAQDSEDPSKETERVP